MQVSRLSSDSQILNRYGLNRWCAPAAHPLMKVSTQIRNNDKIEIQIECMNNYWSYRTQQDAHKSSAYCTITKHQKSSIFICSFKECT